MASTSRAPDFILGHRTNRHLSSVSLVLLAIVALCCSSGPGYHSWSASAAQLNVPPVVVKLGGETPASLSPSSSSLSSSIFSSSLSQPPQANQTSSSSPLISVPNVISISDISSGSSLSSPSIQKRSDDDDEGGDGDEGGGSSRGGKSLFRSIIPLSPSALIKKPIKTIFRNLWSFSDHQSSDGDSSLKDGDSGSSFYFIKPTKKPAPGPPLYSQSGASSIYSSSPYRSSLSSPSSPYISRTSNGRSQYSFNSGSRGGRDPMAVASSNSHPHQYQQQQPSSPVFAIGDPANGRGITLSVGDNPNQGGGYGLATSQNYQTAAAAPTASDSESGSSGGGGGRGGLSFSLGGRGGGGGGGGSGISLSLGGAGGGITGGIGRGLSFSLGGGRGVSLNLGGGRGGGGGETSEQGSSSQNYPSYSGGGGGGYSGSSGYGSSNSYGSSSYGSNSYGNSYNNYYKEPTKPRFSVLMPSQGKTVIEANLRPPALKMKLNASPKVKITTGTRDPLEKPNNDEEIITEDIFGPPAPFEKPVKNNGTENGTMAGMFGNGTFPYPYPYYYPPYYPYNYYYNYYQQQQQQYPGYYPPSTGSGAKQQPPSYGQQPQYGYSSGGSQQQYPGYGGSQYGGQYGSQYGSQYGTPTRNASSTIWKHRPIELAAASRAKWQAMQPPAAQSKLIPTSAYPAPTSAGASFTASDANSQYSPYSYAHSSSVRQQQQQQPYQTGNLMTSASNNKQVNFMDHNALGSYKRSSASSSYSKDMLTLGSNSIAAFAKPDSFRSGFAKGSVGYSSPVVKSSKASSYYRPAESKNYYHYELAQPKLSPQPPLPSSSPSVSMSVSSSSPSAPLSLPSSGHIQQLSGSATNSYPYYSQPGTGLGYSYYNNGTAYMYNGTSTHYPGYPPPTASSHPYYTNPYYYNYYKEYYNYYAKAYYDNYYKSMAGMGNHTSSSTNGTSSSNSTSHGSYYRRKPSITGFSQDQFDHHQAKIFGSRLEKWPGGSTKEEKARIIMDIRPRVTFRMLNRTQAEEEQRNLHKKKAKEHIFRTRMTMLMQTTTTSTTPSPYDQYYKDYYNSYYGYKYYPEEPETDEFGYTKKPHHEELTTVRPKTTTTRRRTTTTEEPASEENNSGESTSSSSEDEDASTTTSTTTTESTPTDEDASEEVDDNKSKEEATSTTTTTSTSTTTEASKSGEEDDVIDDTKTKEADSEKAEEKEEGSDETNSSLEEASKAVTIPVASSAGGNNVTVSPELVAAMIKALQEALGVTPPSVGSQLTTTTTPSPEMSTTTSVGDEGDEDEETNVADPSESAEGKEDNNETEDPEEEETDDATTTTTRKPKSKDTKSTSVRSKQMITVHSAIVKNTTQLRLKTPVVNVRSAKGAASNQVKVRASLSGGSVGKSAKSRVKSSRSEATSSSNSDSELTTTSPFIILNEKRSGSGSGKSLGGGKSSDISKVIDGNAVLSNFNVDDLSDDERRQMLTNILSVIQSKSGGANEIAESETSTASLRSSKSGKKGGKKGQSKGGSLGTKLFPVTKANNVRIISSMDELTSTTTTGAASPDGGKSPNAPIYVVLLPQNKKKK